MPPRALLLALAYAAFASLGLPDGLLGVAWPSMRAGFDLDLDAIGALLAASTSGYVAASAATGRLLQRWGVGTLLATSVLATAASLLGFAIAPSWGAVVACGGVAGLGAGAIDAALNAWAATYTNTRTLNALHACYGLGAAAGPALLASLLLAGEPWQRGYVAVGLTQLALAGGFALTRSRWPAPARRAASSGAAGTRAALRRPATRLGMLCFTLYVGLEQAAGAWAYTLLTEARGVPIASAGAWVSAYWAALMGGRIAFGLGLGRRALDVALRVALLGATAAAVLVATDPFPGAGGIGLVLLGFACGPVFPTLIAATPARVGDVHAAHAVGLQIAAAAAGQALLPWAAGRLARELGLDAIGALLVALAATLVLAHEALARVGRRPSEPPASP